MTDRSGPGRRTGLRRRAPGLVLLFLAALALLPLPARSQDADGTVTVTVRVPGGAALEGADVTASGVAAITDGGGRATLRLPPGPHRLRVSRLGYEERVAPVEVRARAEVFVAVTLLEAAVETEGVIVTSTRADRRIEDEPLRVEVIGREEVEEKLLMTPGDIAMLLNETAGLRVQPTAPSLGGASIRIQGLKGRYTLLLSDGLPLYGGQSGALGPLQIPPMDLGQVEIIKGVASALYGATALGGVVNLVSRRPKPERELLLNGTTQGGGDAVLWLAEDPEGPWSWSLLAGAHAQGDGDVDGDGWADLPAFRRATVRPRLHRDDGAGGSLLLTLGAMMEDRSGGTVDGGSLPGGGARREELSTRRLDLGGVWRSFTEGGRRVSLRGAGAVQRHEHRFGPALERDRHLTGFAEGSLAGTSGRHTWVVGAALQADAYRGEDVPGFDFTHVVPALFAQDEAALSPWLLVSVSARADRHSVYGSFLNPRVSVLARPGAWTVRASAGRGYFAPTPFTDEVEAVGLARVAPLAGELDAERGLSASLDVGRTLGPLELNATLFASRVDDPVEVVEDADGRLRLRNAPGPLRARGIEGLAAYDREPFHVTATYVYTRASELREEARRDLPLTPGHTAGVVGAWEDEAWGRLGVELYYTGAQALDDDPFRERSRGYLVVGFLVERRLSGGARVFLNAENLLDARQTRWSPLVRPTPTAQGRWTTDVWAPLEGRVVNAGVRLPL